ncbi:MAG: tail fiber domain-containing protein [Caulobacteraceae bacterium]|nr:tail fiber domain-containing protein [Caulobacteraceae bacterium]
MNQQPVSTNFNGMTGDVRRNVGTESLQRSLNTNDNPALPQFDSSFRDTVANQLMERMQPIHDYQQKQLETKLANQGFTQGSEAFNRALNELNLRQAAERYNALDTAGNEAQRLYNMGMGARQQAFNEDVTGGQFTNAAANQAFQQGLNANQFVNQATGQAFNQAMQAQQAGNQALGQQFQQGVTNANLNNQALNQAYGQTLGAFNFGNQAQQQLYNQMMGQANLANQAAGQQFNQDMQSRQFSNQALGQAAALDLARMNAQNQAMQQQQGMNQNYANYQNQLRQQAIAEQMQRRGMSLNEMNALLSGQQVNLPQMPSFQPAGRAETPNILGATQMGYDAQLGAANAQNAMFGNLLGAGAQLGSAAFMFSDRRLKSDIKRVGTHAIGVGIYDFTMMGMPQRGVIAQEVQQIRPDLVKCHANGFLMVNYSEL